MKHARSLHVNKNDSPDEDSADEEDEEEYGLEDVFPGIWQYCLTVVAGTLSSAKDLLRYPLSRRISVNFFGSGRHHARKAKANGYCYVNDVVLGILHLQAKGKRVLLVDIDYHHGDMTEKAFLFSKDVLTISFHRKIVFFILLMAHFLDYSCGVFPNSGNIDNNGIGKAKGYNINVPLV